MTFLQEVIDAEISPDHIRRVVHASEAREPDGTPVEFLVLGEFHGELTQRQIAAIVFRMEALAHVIKERKAEKWIVQVLRQEYVLVPDAILIATATAPLILPERGRPSFKMDEFLRIALEQSEAEGRG
jgi:hypothetical protein